MSDEGFHEIEPRGKQLVFLFMAATVVSVVIFLCGVMVGRGVPSPGRADDPEFAHDPSVDPTAVAHAAAAPLSRGAPVSMNEALTYDERLEAETPVAETLRAPVEAASNVPEPASEPIPADARRPSAPAAAEPPVAGATEPRLAEPPGNGYVVQVMAARTREEADRLARGLLAKGYPAFVTVSTADTSSRFRVRVGKYNSLREARSMAERLEKQEQFNIWITR
jgi:cell division septation protein DedD